MSIKLSKLTRCSLLFTVGVLAGLSGCSGHKVHPKAQENADLCADYLGQQLLEQAEARCKIAIEFSPRFAQPYNLLGILERMRGHSDKAIERFKQAITYNDDFAEAHNNLGAEFFDKRLYREAADCFKTALEIDPAYIDARRNMATTYFYLNEFKKASDEFLKCVELDPNSCDCRMGLGTVALEENDFDQARGHFTKLTQICPNSDQAWYNLGFVELKTDRCQQAVTAFMNALALNKSQLEARNALVTAYNCVAMSNEAVKKLIEEINNNPGYPDAHFRLGLVLEEQKQFDQALTEFISTIKLDNTHALAHFHAAKVYDQLLRKDETIDFCKQFVALIKSGDYVTEKSWCVQRVKALEFE